MCVWMWVRVLDFRAVWMAGGGGGAAAKGSSGGVRGVRIVVAGDRGTGKSSLIVTAAAETFPINVPLLLPPTRLPEDMYPDRVPVTIIDTSSRFLSLDNLIFRVVLCFNFQAPLRKRAISCLVVCKRINVLYCSVRSSATQPQSFWAQILVFFVIFLDSVRRFLAVIFLCDYFAFLSSVWSSLAQSQ